MDLIDKYINNPCRHNSDKFKNALWYDYYASYSPEFVVDVLNYLSLEKNALIMDPWNGSGTTTSIVRQMGYNSIGLDINPAMIIVAKSRLIGWEVVNSLQSIGEDIIKKARCFQLDILADPLDYWLTKGSVRIIRNIDYAIQQLLIDCKYSYLNNRDIDKVSSLALFFYVALFRTVKELLNCFRSSNPTWIRRPKNDDGKKSFEEHIVYELFLSHVQKMINIILLDKEIDGEYIGKKLCKFQLASSESIPVDDNIVDAVITSPPYCTRIDYAIATLIELAIIGFSIDKELKNLRDKMIGSPTIIKQPIFVKREWGKLCVEFLDIVAKHNSKASCSYYYKNFVQYFNSIYNSFIEINRTLKSGGNFVLVVQDSYYKNIHLDLCKIIEDMGNSFCWKLNLRLDFPKTQTLVHINKRASKYRVPVAAMESVIFFSKSN